MAVALVGQIRHQINAIDVVEATKLGVTKNQPLTKKKGAAGYIGTSKGIGDTTIHLTFAVPALKMQFQAFAMEASEGQTGFTYTFFEGTTVYQVPNCFAGNSTMDNMPETGDTNHSLEIQGGIMRQTSI